MAEPTALEDNNLNLAYPDNSFTEFISRTDLNPGANKLSFFHLNIRSLRLNFDKLKILQDATCWISSKALCRGTNRQHPLLGSFKENICIVSNDK